MKKLKNKKILIKSQEIHYIKRMFNREMDEMRLNRRDDLIDQPNITLKSNIL